MSIGTSLVSKLSGVVTWEDAKANITLDWDSKNFNLADTVTPSDAFLATLNKTIADPADIVNTSDSIIVSPGINIADTQSVTDALVLAINIAITETVIASDAITEYVNGTLNGSALNTRRLADGDTPVSGTNILITIT